MAECSFERTLKDEGGEKLRLLRRRTERNESSEGNNRNRLAIGWIGPSPRLHRLNENDDRFSYDEPIAIQVVLMPFEFARVGNLQLGVYGGPVLNHFRNCAEAKQRDAHQDRRDPQRCPASC